MEWNLIKTGLVKMMLIDVGFAALNPTYGGYGVKRGYMVCGDYAG